MQIKPITKDLLMTLPIHMYDAMAGNEYYINMRNELDLHAVDTFDLLDEWINEHYGTSRHYTIMLFGDKEAAIEFKLAW